MYCDADRDMVADVPTDPKKLKNPSTLVFTYTPIEDPAVYQNIFKDFLEKFSACTGQKVVYYQVQSNAAQIEAMRAGRLHIAGFSTGGTGYAVNLAGAVPFVVKGDAPGPRSYHLALIVRADSPYQKPSDLKGKKVAHVSPSSNSGNLAPRALFPAQGLVPDTDYKLLYSGKHDQSILGVNGRRLRRRGRCRRRPRAHGQARRGEGRELPQALHQPALRRPPPSPTRTTSSRRSPRRSASAPPATSSRRR